MLKQTLNQKLLQKLSPQQIQFIQLLQLNSAEIESKVEEELAENAALETGKEDGDMDGDELDMEKDMDSESVEHEDTFEDLGDYLSDDDDYHSYTPEYDKNEERREIPHASITTLYESLQEQLNAVELNPRQKLIADHLIGMIEEDGYLRRPLKNISYDMAFINNIQTDEIELEEILEIIQSLDPPGIGARDLRECLLIQLGKKDPKNEDVQLAKTVIKSYLKELGNKHYDKLMKQLRINKSKLKIILEIITKLNPKPGESQVNTKTQYIIPDFLVTQLSDGEFQISLNAKNAPHLHVNKSFQDKIKAYVDVKKKNKKIKEELQFIKQKLDNAKWFIEAIKQRQNTLLLTMSTIVDLQKDFFANGEFVKLKPMILKDIANRIEMDISTVSRVVSSKYVQTDFGIFPLREFFSEGIMKDDGEEVSNREVKKYLSEFIEKESKRKPLTDEKLTRLLNEKGYNIARRTVAKYREQMDIPVARLRKEL
jgi:RNA polymerase sigma-54 factor